MIIYGAKDVHIHSTNPKQLTCPSCETQGSIQMDVFRKHAHVFWIPLFPMNKSGGSICTHCKQQMTKKQMPENFKQALAMAKSESHGPFWQFAGLGIILIGISAASVLTTQSKKKYESMVAEPQVNDMYVLKGEEKGYYTLGKVLEMEDDSIFILFNDYSINTLSDVESLDKEENYSDGYYGFVAEDIQGLFDDGEIKKVLRD